MIVSLIVWTLIQLAQLITTERSATADSETWTPLYNEKDVLGLDRPLHAGESRDGVHEFPINSDPSLYLLIVAILLTGILSRTGVYLY